MIRIIRVLDAEYMKKQNLNEKISHHTRLL